MPMKGREKNRSINWSDRAFWAIASSLWVRRTWRQNRPSTTASATMARVVTALTHQASTCTGSSTSARSILATTRQSVPATGLYAARTGTFRWSSPCTSPG